jgi:UDP-N-acetylmuramoyl-tripeptide--D-alanyl-D-alanine ligase
LLSFDEKTEIGIVEMGANHKKEIAFLCDLAQPDYGYITNFGKAHLEGFGGVEGVIQGKSEMYDYLSKNHKVAFINLDDPIQVEKSKVLNSYSFGLNNESADVNINAITANPFVKISFSNSLVQTHLIGLYNANNVNAAITIGKYFRIEDLDIKEALESYIPENNRSQILSKGSNQIILDAYNANPSSMAVAIANFLQLDEQNKIIILGDMFELGAESGQEHKAIMGLLLNEKDITCYFIGKEFSGNRMDKKDFYFYDTFESFSVHLQETKIENSYLLIKGSRGMALERTLDFL